MPFGGEPGRWNLITDVPGVEVGFVTLIEGEGASSGGAGPVRTGVTAVLPRGRADATLPCAAAIHSLNGNGEMTGAHWVTETGAVHTPIAISNSHAIGACHRGIVEWMLESHPEISDAWILPVAAETFDGYLNDINGRHVTVEHVVGALNSARSGPFVLGSVGGGTGMNCYQFKGGTGSASRTVRYAGSSYTVGVLLQANFGARSELVIAGVPVGAHLLDDNPLVEESWHLPPGGGSVIAIVATDAPMLPGQCAALARRVPLGLARTGTSGSHFSGDLFLAFSVANRGALRAVVPHGEPDSDGLDHLSFVEWGRIDPFYTAVVEAVEEATVDALVCNETMIGRDGHRSPALPRDRLVDLLASAGRLETR